MAIYKDSELQNHFADLNQEVIPNLSRRSINSLSFTRAEYGGSGLIPKPDSNFTDKEAALFHGAVGTRERLAPFLKKLNDPNVRVFPYHGLINVDYEKKHHADGRYQPKDFRRYQPFGTAFYNDWNKGGQLVHIADIPHDETRYIPSEYYPSEQIKESSFFSGYFVFSEAVPPPQLIGVWNRCYALLFIGYVKPKNEDLANLGIIGFSYLGDFDDNPFSVNPDHSTSNNPNPRYDRWRTIGTKNGGMIITDTKSSKELANLSKDVEVIKRLREKMNVVLEKVEKSNGLFGINGNYIKE